MQRSASKTEESNRLREERQEKGQKNIACLSVVGQRRPGLLEQPSAAENKVDEKNKTRKRLIVGRLFSMCLFDALLM